MAAQKVFDPRFYNVERSSLQRGMDEGFSFFGITDLVDDLGRASGRLNTAAGDGKGVWFVGKVIVGDERRVRLVGFSFSYK